VKKKPWTGSYNWRPKYEGCLESSRPGKHIDINAASKIFTALQDHICHLSSCEYQVDLLEVSLRTDFFLIIMQVYFFNE
jgi:hypothetical protein